MNIVICIADGSKPPEYEMEPNSCYVMTQIKENEAYETRPHVYDEIDLPPVYSKVIPQTGAQKIKHRATVEQHIS